MQVRFSFCCTTTSWTLAWPPPSVNNCTFFLASCTCVYDRERTMWKVQIGKGATSTKTSHFWRAVFVYQTNIHIKLWKDFRACFYPVCPTPIVIETGDQINCSWPVACDRDEYRSGGFCSMYLPAADLLFVLSVPNHHNSFLPHVVSQTKSFRG